MKKILSVLLCIMLFVGTLSVSAPALAQKIDAAEKTTFIVELEGENALDALNEGMSLKKALDPINKNRKNAVQAIESVSKDAEVVYTYTHVLNGVAVEAAKGDIDRIKELNGVSAVYDVGGVKVSVENVPNDSLISSGTMIGLDKLHEMGIDGTGTAIAVIDGGLDCDHEVLRLSDPASAKITKADVAKVISENTMNFEGFSADDLYKSAKVPFAFDYCDGDTVVNDDNNSFPDHGTHVSGIAAGNSENLVGVAPEAQILMFKIDGYDDEIFVANLLAAIDDAAKFDIASINMSVGLDFETPGNPAYKLIGKAITNARNSGIAVCAAAGNRYVSTDSVLNPDNGTNGIPDSFKDSTSVASVDNVNLSKPIVYYINSLKYGDGKEVYVEDWSTVAFPSEGEYVPVNYKEKNVNLEGKVALFYDTRVDVSPYLYGTSIKGIILSYSVLDNLYNSSYYYDEEAETPPLLLVDNNSAYRLAHSEKKNYELTYESYYVEPSDVLRPSEFTSYGVSEDLEMTVDLAAPGGMIYSSVVGSYDVYDGTSMASPHAAGSAALLEQYFAGAYPEAQGREKADLKESLLCSTADPVVVDGVATSPRAVGAGLINLQEAVSAKAVLIGKGGNTAINLGDKIDDSVKMSFTVKNVSNETVRYDTLDLDVVTDEYDTYRYFNPFTGKYETELYITGKSVPLKYTVAQSDMPRSIVLQPGESRTVTLTVALDAQQLAENAGIFSNGFYVEGYIYLTDSISGNTPLNIPFMGFRGDWNAIPAVTFGETYENFLGFMVENGIGYTVNRNLQSLTFTLLDENGKKCASHTVKNVNKTTSYTVDGLEYLFDEEDVADGTYTVSVSYVLNNYSEPEYMNDGVQVTIDRTAPTIIGVKKVRTDKGCDILITCDCDDLDYVELEGATMLDLKFYDLYPFESYDHVDGDGNYVYVVHENEKIRGRVIVNAYDYRGNMDSFGRYSLFRIIYTFFKELPGRLLSRFLYY